MAVWPDEAKLQPLAEMPEPAATLSAPRAKLAAATVLAHEAKLQPLAEMMPEKLRQQQH